MNCPYDAMQVLSHGASVAIALDVTLGAADD